MRKVYVFDIDGTLTPPRQKMDENFAEFFLPFAKENIVYLATGSDIEKAREQVDQRILMMCQGVFTCSGNEFWERGKKIYSNEFYPRPKLVTFLEKCVKDSGYHTKTGNHLEYRNGMLNFSVVGRNATLDQRAAYMEWDESADQLNVLGTALLNSGSTKVIAEFTSSNTNRMVIYPRGKDKSQAVSKIRQLHDLSIVFMGDRMEPNGNDYPAAKALKAGDTACQVENWKMTELLIRQEMEK